MPEITTTGWKHKIRAYCDSNGIPKTDSAIQRMALKISKRMAAMNKASTMTEDELFFEGLRILGIISDDTARIADQRIETRALLNRMGVAA